ncbi:SRPBCC family protein [Cohnella soli]|uniref:SRPBCC family protein n=1 Tax=Cohnella soli TaxID=425005 RepID=A0ABW0HNA3_9BACL
MNNSNQKPVVKAEMLIRKPAQDVYEAFVDPAITTLFWFTRSSGRLEQGSRVRWEWEMYGAVDEIQVLELVPNKRIRIESSDGTQVEWTLTARSDAETFVTITNSGFTGSEEAIVGRALDSMGGYTMVLCGLKALLEHGIELNLVADYAPDAHVSR